jgi:hypothetical protein
VRYAAGPDRSCPDHGAAAPPPRPRPAWRAEIARLNAQILADRAAARREAAAAARPPRPRPRPQHDRAAAELARDPRRTNAEIAVAALTCRTVVYEVRCELAASAVTARAGLAAATATVPAAVPRVKPPKPPRPPRPPGPPKPRRPRRPPVRWPHGSPLRRRAEAALLASPERPNTEIGAEIGAGKEVVRRVRDILEARGDIARWRTPAH